MDTHSPFLRRRSVTLLVAGLVAVAMLAASAAPASAALTPVRTLEATVSVEVVEAVRAIDDAVNEGIDGLLAAGDVTAAQADELRRVLV